MVLSKNIFTILILVIFSSCSSKKVNNIIAHNISESVQLTKDTFDNWMHDNPEVAKNSYNEQIESYFIQKYLLDRRELLGKTENEKNGFIAKLKGIRKARGMVKETWKKNVDVDQLKVNELYAAYQENYDNKIDKVRLYQIFKRFPPNASEKDKQKVYNSMVSIRKSINGLSSFKSIAQKQSNSQSRLRDGLIGNIGKGIFDPDLEGIVMAMKPDELSEIIKTKKGYVLFFCERRVPKIKREEGELYDIAHQNIFSQNLSMQWPEYLSKQVKTLKIKYNWNLIRNDKDQNSIVVTSESGSLTKTQLLWVLNEDINDYKLFEYNNDTIKRRVEYYLLNQLFYSRLSSEELKDINHYVNFTNTNFTVSAVLLHLIHKRFVPPTDKEMMQYYLKNKYNYSTKKKIDYSYVALNLANKNKADVYKKAEEILFNLQNDKLDFSDAIKLYSAPEKKLNYDSTGLITIKQSSHLYGINVNKQLKLMQENEISDLVESDSGYIWILRLNKIQQSRQESFLEAKNSILRDIGNMRLRQLKEKVYLDILNEENIKLISDSYTH